MIQQKLQTDQIQALKSGDKTKLNVLRYILAQIKNKEIEKKAALTDEEVFNVLKKVAKELRESIESFEKGGRADLVEEYKKQYDILQPYLPREISDEELKTAVRQLIETNKEIYEKSPKAIIGICMKELRSKADPSRILKILQSLT